MENRQANVNASSRGDGHGTVSTEGQQISQMRLSSSLGRLYGECCPPGFLRKVAAEVIATYMLVFVTCGSAALKVSKLGASVAGGLIVTVMIYAVGHISGAHMNPAVTLAFAAVRHFPWKQVPFYAGAQLTGAASAGFTLHVLLHPIKHVGTTSPSGETIQALIMEIVVTFSMMFVTSAVATDTKAVRTLNIRPNRSISIPVNTTISMVILVALGFVQIGELAGIAVGSAVCISSILAGPISGGSMNPARSIGPAIASNYYERIWVYVVGPVCGTLLGAWSYNFIRVTDKPVHAISNSLSFQLRRMRSNEESIADKDPLNSL